jgi:hypothetical protein
MHDDLMLMVDVTLMHGLYIILWLMAHGPYAADFTYGILKFFSNV